MSGQRYTPEFKDEAVKLITERLGTTTHSLYVGSSISLGSRIKYLKIKMEQSLEHALALSYGDKNNLIDSIQAIEQLIFLAKTGNAEAMYQLALYYDFDRYDSMLARNDLLRDEYLLASSRLGNTNAILKLVKLLKYQRTVYDSLGYPSDLPEKLVDELHSILDQLIELGNVTALILKGWQATAYQYFENVELLYKAWMAGEKISASLFLSRCDDDDLKQYGLEKPEYWQAIFDTLQEKFMNNLEQEFQFGNIKKILDVKNSEVGDAFSESNREKINQWIIKFYQKQADAGSVDALLQLRHYKEEESHNDLKKASELGHPVAQFAYALFLDDDEQLQEQYRSEIKKLFDQAAEKNHPKSLYEKACYYISDEPELAKQLCIQSSELGCIEAMDLLVELTKEQEQIKWAELSLKNGIRSDLIDEVMLAAIQNKYITTLKNTELLSDLLIAKEAKAYYDNLFGGVVELATKRFNEEVEPQMNALFEDSFDDEKVKKTNFIGQIKKWFKS